MNNNTKFIKNKLNGYHLNSKYWQDIKNNKPGLSLKLYNISIGMLLGDATMYKVSINALIKFEQGYLQESFINHLFALYKEYTFMTEPGKRLELHHPVRKGLVKSYWFKTFSHETSNSLWETFYINGKKQIPDTLELSAECISYWIMCDGSLAKDNQTMILHTQSYNLEDNQKLSLMLNKQWELDSRVIPHKEKYYVILIPKKNSNLLKSIIIPHIFEEMKYKIPVI